MKRKVPRNCNDENFIVPPPSTVVVEVEPKIVLYKADGTPLKRQISYKP